MASPTKRMPRALIRRQKGGFLLPWMALTMLCGRFLRKALQGDEVVLRQVVEVADVLHQALVHQLQDDLFPQAVDVHAALPGKVHDRAGSGPRSSRGWGSG